MVVESITLNELGDCTWENIASNDGMVNMDLDDHTAAPANNVVPKNIPSKIAPKNILPTKAIVGLAGNFKEKSKKAAFSFRRTKTAKEIIQENKRQWDELKLEKKAKQRMEQIKLIEDGKQKRHDERCEVIKKLVDKM